MEFTQENFNKLLKTAEEVENYKKAVSEERTRRKQEAEEKQKTLLQLEELQSFKSGLEEKEAKKKGKYEEIIVEKDKQIEELTQKIGWIETKATKHDEFMTKTLDEKFQKIPEEKQEFVKKILTDKSFEDQSELLDGFVQDYNVDFKAKPKQEGEEIPDTSELDKAKKEWNTMWVIANAPVLETE